MCTAVTYQTRDFYFGRTLDYDISYSEEVTVTPRNFPLPFRHRPPMAQHHAIIGMAHVMDDYPLYFDAVNEKGLAMAGLNFVGYTHYRKPAPEGHNIASFELIPWLLGQCATVAEARPLLEELTITDTPFREDLPPSQLHWLLADQQEAVTIEALEGGLTVTGNPLGVLTNNPPFRQQLLRLSDFLHLSPEEPKNTFCPDLPLEPYSRGLGATGLPGDLSSTSRFIRAAFMKLNSRSGISESESLSQFFHILESVQQPMGCCRLENGSCEFTQYTSCCNTDKGIYYYRTYNSPRITGVNLHREQLDSNSLIRYPLILTEPVVLQN